MTDQNERSITQNNNVIIIIMEPLSLYIDRILFLLGWTISEQFFLVELQIFPFPIKLHVRLSLKSL